MSGSGSKSKSKSKSDGPHGYLILDDLFATVKQVVLPYSSAEQCRVLQELVAGGEGNFFEMFHSPCGRYVFYGDAAGKHGNLNPFLDFLLGEGHSVAGTVFVFKYSSDAYSDGPYAHEDPNSAPTIIYHNGPVPPSPSVPPRKSLRLSEKAGVTPLTLTTLEPCEDSMGRLYGCF